MAAGETTAASGGLAAAHARLVAGGATQFGLPAFRPEPPPGWLQLLVDWLSHAGPFVKYAFWGGVTVITLLVLRALYPVALRLLNRRAEGAEDEGWRPEAATARQLLAEADALAADGEFGEATHLVLLRSIEQIAARRPGALRPASTSRDIARAEALPGDVAQAFSLIAGIVEGGLFAARPVGSEAWTHCRQAYEAVAFPKAWA